MTALMKIFYVNLFVFTLMKVDAPAIKPPEPRCELESDNLIIDAYFQANENEIIISHNPKQQNSPFAAISIEKDGVISPNKLDEHCYEPRITKQSGSWHLRMICEGFDSTKAMSFLIRSTVRNNKTYPVNSQACDAIRQNKDPDTSEDLRTLIIVILVVLLIDKIKHNLPAWIKEKLKVLWIGFLEKMPGYKTVPQNIEGKNESFESSILTEIKNIRQRSMRIEKKLAEMNCSFQKLLAQQRDQNPFPLEVEEYFRSENEQINSAAVEVGDCLAIDVRGSMQVHSARMPQMEEDGADADVDITST